MPDALRLITSPLPVAAGLGYPELSAAVAADALARRAWAGGRPATVTLTALAGDLGGRLAFDGELVRLGHDRAATSRAELDELARAFDAGRREAAAARLEVLGVAPELDDGTATPAASVAAAVAFVRLHESGLIAVGPAVVPHCPSCATVIEGPDAVAGEAEAEVLRVRIDDDLDLDVSLTAPELLDGVAAIAVPVGHPAAGLRVVVPVTEVEVPVVAETGCVEPRFLVPAHDQGAYDLALLEGLVPVAVLNEAGTIEGDGVLGGLPRFAARQVARGLLEAEGVVVDVVEGVEDVVRCRQCGSVASSILGDHWMLRLTSLETAAGDAVRDDSVTFIPGDWRDAVLSASGSRPWCLDRSVPGGIELPAHRCRDCLQITVAVDAPDRCGKCFGELEPIGATLDARFVAALSPLVRAGWPGRISTDHLAAAAATVAVVTPDAMQTWAVPALALGLHLAGYVPFATVVVQPPLATAADLPVPDEAVEMRAARLALLATVDVEIAAAAVAGLDEPSAGDDPDATAAVMSAIEDAVSALDDLGPGRAAGLLLAALTGGVPVDSVDRAGALALPFLGA